MGRVKRESRSRPAMRPSPGEIDARPDVGRVRDRRAWIVLAILAGAATLLLGSFTPPFQSPDEYVHVKMAHLVSHGSLPQWQPDGSLHGGPIDSALVEYARLYNEPQVPRPQPVTPEAKQAAESLRWAGQAELSSCPNIYLPVVYLPQAIALRAGELLGITVGGSYRLARFAATLTVVLLLAIAFALYVPSPLAAAVVVLPMTLFQMSSASIDGITIGMICVAVSAYLRIWRDGDRAPRYAFVLMLAMLSITVPSRPYLLPLFALPSLLAWRSRRLSWAAGAAVAAAIPVAWLMYVMSPGDVEATAASVARARPPLSEIISFYVQNPARIPRVIAATAGDGPTTNLYYESFVGLLGWLDTRFSRQDYQLLYGMLLVAMGLSIAPSCMSRMRVPSIALAACGVASLVLVFLSLWLLFSPHPTFIIRGVQGRYFAIPVILLAFALSPDQASRPSLARWLGFAAVAAMLVFSTVMTVELLQRKHEGYFRSVAPPVTGSSALELQLGSARRS